MEKIVLNVDFGDKTWATQLPGEEIKKNFFVLYSWGSTQYMCEVIAQLEQPVKPFTHNDI